MKTKEIQVSIYPDGRLNTENAAIYLGLSEKTLAMMRCQGTGPQFIKRGKIFYFREDLDDWVSEGGRVKSTSEQRAKQP